LNMLHSR